MRLSTVGTSLCCVFLLIVCSLAGPIKNHKDDKKSESAPSQVGDQEQALEQLAALAANKLGNNVAVQKQQSVHYSNVNGKEQSDTKAEQKVLNSVSGDVVLDIKQHQNTHDVKGEPKTESETDIDIPAAGIHKNFINNDDDSAENEVTDQSQRLSGDPDVFKFTPSAVAEYLLQTGEFDEFDEALAELVNSSAMTDDEADEYRNNVREEYNRLLQEAPAQSSSTDEELYPLLLNDVEGEPESYDLPVDDIYQLYNYNNKIPPLDIEELQNQAMMREAIARKQTLNALIKELIDEWLTRAITTGDRNAGAMLGNIMSVVSRDEDPDDYKQVRQTLSDIFADEVLRSLKPRKIAPEEYSLYDSIDLEQEPYRLLPQETDQLINSDNTGISDDNTDISDDNTNNSDDDAEENRPSSLKEQNTNNKESSNTKKETEEQEIKDTKEKRSVKLSEEDIMKLRM